MGAKARAKSLRERLLKQVSANDHELQFALQRRIPFVPVEQEVQARWACHATFNTVFLESVDSFFECIAWKKKCSAAPERVDEDVNARRTGYRPIAIDPSAVCI